MHQIFWNPPIVELSKPNVMGGYLSQFTKERILMKKKQAKALNKVINKITTTSDNIANHSRIFSFLVDRLITKDLACMYELSKLELRNTPVIPPISNQLDDIDKLQKERVKLKKKEVPYLEYIVQLCIKKFIASDPKYCLQESSFVVSDIFLPGSHSKPSKHVIEDVMPVKELGPLNGVLNEKLMDSSIQEIIPKNPLEVKPLDTICRFLFNANPCIQDNNRTRVPIDLHTWEVNLKEDSDKIADIFFRDLEDKLFDIQFHKLEFFRLACDRLPRKTTRKVKVKRYWILSNTKLKQMKWAPFRNWNSSSMIKEIEEEQINFVKYSISNTPITINYIPNTDLELYSSNKVFFSTSQINTTNTMTNKIADSITTSNNPNEKEIPKDIHTDTDISNNSDPTENTKINTSLLPQKRSFLDSDLQSLIKRKKHSFEQSGTQHIDRSGLVTDVMEEDASEIFRSGIFDKPTESGPEHLFKKRADPIKITQEEESGLVNFQFNLDSQVDIKDRLIIFNVNKISKNYKLLQYLINHNSQCCTIMERELLTECDLILNSCTCVIRIELSKFFQRDGSNRLHFSDIVSSCIAEYKRVKVIIEYRLDTLLYDKDIFWKIFYFLPFPKFELFFVVKDDISVLAHCINQLIWKEAAHDFTEEDFMEDNMKDDSIILSILKFNPILIMTLLKGYTLSELISQVNNGLDPQLIQIMTVSQLNRLKRLNSINW